MKYWRTSENAVNAKFAERRKAEVRRIGGGRTATVLVA
jgi:hypothetical protein